MKDDMMMRFEPLDMDDIFKNHGAVPNIGVNGDELKFLNVPKVTVVLKRDLTLNTIFTGVFSDGRAMRKSEILEKAIPMVLAHFGNKTEASAKRAINHWISWFTNWKGTGGFTEFRLEKVA